MFKLGKRIHNGEMQFFMAEKIKMFFILANESNYNTTFGVQCMTCEKCCFEKATNN